MVNEFEGLTDILFDPKATGGGTTIITGDEWLINFGIDPVTNKNLLVQGIGALSAYTVGLLATAFIILAWLQRYVK